MDREILKDKLYEATGGCAAQHDGWPCGTCFFNLGTNLTNQDWQALLLFRGDYPRETLDNLPDDIERSLNKIMALC